MRKKLGCSVALLSCSALIGCETNTGTGALVGGGGGALAGGLIGSMSHSRAGEGALIGAAVGAIGGALVGHVMDENDKREDKADVQQVVDNTQPVTKADVLYWSERGVSDEAIIDRIGRSRTVFHMTAADETKLRDRGVSERVISEMRYTAR